MAGKRHSNKEKDSRYISGREAAKILGVTARTVQNWMKSGQIQGKVERKKIQPRNLILVRTLKDVLYRRCRVCGRRFRAKNRKKAFCSKKHRNRWFNVLQHKEQRGDNVRQG